MARFMKGVSGNPAGRPPGARGLRSALVARYGEDGAVLVERLEALSKLTDPRYAKIAMYATELLLAYLAGKPVQTTEVSGPGGTAFADLSTLSTSELRARVTAMLDRWPGSPSSDPSESH